MSNNTNSPELGGSHLCIRDEGGAWRPATREEIISAARTALARRIRRGTTLDSPHVVRDFLKVKLSALDHEVFCGIFLDTRHLVIEYRELFRGTIDGATVYPREVVKRALQHNASAVIAGHNHPSGVSEPSEADRSITLKLAKALALVEIRLLDHVVVSRGGHVSLAERGWL